MTNQIDARALKHFWEDETPSGTINGSNVTFTLAQTPHENAVVRLYQDGLFLKQGTDYTLSGATITMTTAPAVGQSLRANYVRSSGE